MSQTFHFFNTVIDDKKIKTVFQPIVSLRDGSVFAYEALSRITDPSPEMNIEELFHFSEIYNRIWDLEFLCRTTALETAFQEKKLPPECKLFLNVNPNVMHDIKFRQGFTKDYLNQYGITPEKIVFEITERNAIKDMQGFMSTVSHYKVQNYQIAIDDAGAGYSGLNLISDLRPHFIKIDINLVRNIHIDSIKYALVKSMVELSNIANISLIAEGIETFEELKTLINLGVQYGQGYYIQKPSDAIGYLSCEVLSHITEINRRKNHMNYSQARNIYIEHLCSNAVSVPPSMPVEQVFDLLSKHPYYQGVCVVQNEEVVGVVMRNKLILQLSGRYGFTLYQRKQVSEIMDRNFMSVDSKTPISTVSQIATLRDDDNLYDFIVITRNKQLLGTVTVKDLLQKITDIELINAKHQNPLSGLPGNIEIESKMLSCFESKIPADVLYIDIDNFKPYNDVYGFEKGDVVIKSLADVLKSLAEDAQFVGHIGGDDFVVIGKSADLEMQCLDILQQFRAKAVEFYNEKDLENGYIVAKNRGGVVEQIPLLSISIAGVRDFPSKFLDVFSMTEALAALKKEIKHEGGSTSKIL